MNDVDGVVRLRLVVVVVVMMMVVAVVGYAPIDIVIVVPCTCWKIHSDIEWPCCDTRPISVMYDIRSEFVGLVVIVVVAAGGST